MKKFTKRLLTGTIALGLLAPVATSAISQPRATIQAHASTTLRYYGGIKGLRFRLSMTPRYAYLYSKGRDESGYTMKYHLRYRGHRTWRGYSNEFNPITIHIINNRKLHVSGIDAKIHYMYGNNAVNINYGSFKNNLMKYHVMDYQRKNSSYY